MKSRYRVGTRGSKLALTQTQQTLDALAALHPGVRFETVVIKTTGDKITDVALSRIGDKGLFVKEIEQALLDGEVDVAVHSMKDMPTDLPSGLMIGCVPERKPAFDALITTAPITLDTLPVGALIGTGSLRRRAQLAAARPDLQFAELRGNLPTRLARLTEGRFVATLLAAAGLMRLGALEGEGHHACILSPETCVPAVGQGALCLEQREGDRDVAELFAPFNHEPSMRAVEAERAFLHAVQGGCQIPAGAYAEAGEEIHLRAILCSLDGQQVYRTELRGTDGVTMAQSAAQALLKAGGQAVLDAIRTTGHSARQPELT